VSAIGHLPSWSLGRTGLSTPPHERGRTAVSCHKITGPSTASASYDTGLLGEILERPNRNHVGFGKSHYPHLRQYVTSGGLPSGWITGRTCKSLRISTEPLHRKPSKPGVSTVPDGTERRRASRPIDRSNRVRLPVRGLPPQRVPTEFEEIARVSKLDEGKVRMGYKVLNREIDLPVPPAGPKQYPPRIASAADVSQETERRAWTLLDDAQQGLGATGCNPAGIAAGALYLAGQYTEACLTQADIAAAADVSTVTVRERYRDIRS
jgi:hypothetical protein